MSLLLLSLLACRNGDSDTPDPVDTGCTTSVTAYPDQDGDTYGSDPAVEVCQHTPGYIDTTGDCDDTDPSIYPGATDLPLDGIDQDCDGADNRDGDGDGDPIDTDCDDSDPDRSTLLFELCDTGVDEDCDGIVDEDCQYFGGVASGVADHRIEGIWVDDWQNNSRAGRGVFGLPDISGDGVPDIAVAGDTYDERFVHIFSGQDVLDAEVLDFDDALFAVSSANGAGGLGEIEFMGAFSSGSNQYLVVQDDLCDVFDLSDRPEGDPLYWGDGLFGYGHGTCHLALLDHALPTNIHLGGASLFLRNYLLEDESYQTTSIDLDGTIPTWSATDDWNGDGVNEILVGSYILDEPYTAPQILWHGEGPFDLDTAYSSEVMSQVDSTEPGRNINFINAYNRPDLSEDLNGDGYPELLIEMEAPASQKELLIWNDTNALDLSAPDIHVVNHNDNFRYSSKGTFHFGDINCDGVPDLVQSFVKQNDFAGLALALGPLETGTIEIQSEPDGLLAQAGFETENDFAGHAALLPDLNGDGCQELLVGDPSYKIDPERFGPGAAHLFLGAPGGL